MSTSIELLELLFGASPVASDGSIENTGATESAIPGTSASGSITSHPETTDSQNMNRIVIRRVSGRWAVTRTGAHEPRKSIRRKAPKRRYEESIQFTRPLPMRKRQKRVVPSVPEDSSTDDAVSDDEIDEYLGFSYHDTAVEQNLPLNEKGKQSRGGKSRTIGSLFSKDQNQAIFNNASPNLKVSS